MKSNNHPFLLQFCPSHSSTQDDSGNTKVACSSTCSTHLTLFWLTTVQTVPSMHLKKNDLPKQTVAQNCTFPLWMLKLICIIIFSISANKISFFLASHRNLNICHLQIVWPIKNVSGITVNIWLISTLTKGFVFVNRGHAQGSQCIKKKNNGTLPK